MLRHTRNNYVLHVRKTENNCFLVLERWLTSNIFSLLKQLLIARVSVLERRYTHTNYAK